MPGKTCSSSLVKFSTPNKAAKSSELSEQEYTDYDLPLALLSLLPHATVLFQLLLVILH